MRVEGDELVFPDESLAADADLWLERLSRYNRSIHRVAKREGNPIRPYKPFDPVNLYLAVLKGVFHGDVALLAHEVIWRQPFPNANHRTVTAALLEELDVDATPEHIQRATRDAFERSKRLLDGSDERRTNEQAKQEHLGVVRGLLDTLQSMR